MPATRELLLRGQERYNIFCSVCHGKSGDGQGIIMTGNYGYTPAPSYHDERLREATDGYLYDVIANGVRNMPGYAQQVPVADRWAIVAYLRALQRSQNATEADIPPSVRARIEQGSSANMNAARTGADGAGAAVADTAATDTTQAGAAQTDSAQTGAAPTGDAAQDGDAQADTTQGAAGSEDAPADSATTGTPAADTAATDTAATDTTSQQ